MNTKGFEETLDYYANEINDIIDSFRIDKRLASLARIIVCLHAHTSQCYY